MLGVGWQHFVGRVAGRAVGMVVGRGEKATDFCGFLGCLGVADVSGGVGLVNPNRRGVVLVEVAVVWGMGWQEWRAVGSRRVIVIGNVRFIRYGCYVAYWGPL